MKEGYYLMSRMIFDTETTSIEKPFAYNVGYRIVDDDFNVLVEKDFVIEQIWHNLPLFESAYYHDKRPLYVLAMRKHETIMTKWGYMVSEMLRDIKKHEVTSAYAFNSNFDENVFNFCCDWFKTRNPFDTIPIYDIWGYSSQFITNTTEYRTFCELHELFTDKGLYQGNAEALTKFLTCDTDFEEAHTALADARIETDILKACVNRGAELDKEYKVVRFLRPDKPTPYAIKVNGEIIHEGQYTKKYVRNEVYSFTEEVEEVVE